jgi:hypothetical protein
LADYSGKGAGPTAYLKPIPARYRRKPLEEVVSNSSTPPSHEGLVCVAGCPFVERTVQDVSLRMLPNGLELRSPPYSLRGKPLGGSGHRHFILEPDLGQGTTRVEAARRVGRRSCWSRRVLCGGAPPGAPARCSAADYWTDTDIASPSNASQCHRTRIVCSPLSCEQDATGAS